MLGAVRVTSESLDSIVQAVAAKYNVDPDLVRGFIKKESNWDVNASRYEAHLNDSSWGLMQVLLKTAQWILANDNLTISQLISPNTNIEAGTKYIRYLLDKYKGNVRDAIAAYNAGSPRKDKNGKYVNQSYVDDVYRNYMMYRTIGAAVTPGEASLSLGALAALGLGVVLVARR